MNWIWPGACVAAKKILWTLVGSPIFYVYINGPGWVGGWKSRPEEDICAQLTSVKADFWYQHKAQCEDLIFRDFHAIYAVVQLGLYLCFMFQLVQACFYRYIFFRPLYNYRDRMLELCYAMEKKENFPIAAPICYHNPDK